MFIASAEIWQVRRAPPTLSTPSDPSRSLRLPLWRTMNHSFLVGRAHVTGEDREYVCMYVHTICDTLYALWYSCYTDLSNGLLSASQWATASHRRCGAA